MRREPRLGLLVDGSWANIAGMSDTVDAVIIGGGIAGVSVGYELCQRGLSVQLLEAEHAHLPAEARLRSKSKKVKVESYDPRPVGRG